MFRSVQGWGRSGGLGEGEEGERRLLGAVPVAGSVPASSGDGLFVGHFGEEFGGGENEGWAGRLDLFFTAAANLEWFFTDWYRFSGPGAIGVEFS